MVTLEKSCDLGIRKWGIYFPNYGRFERGYDDSPADLEGPREAQTGLLRSFQLHDVVYIIGTEI